MADLAYRDGRVVLADPKGNIGDVAPEELQHYLDEGYTPVAQHALTKAEQDAAERDRLESPAAKVGVGLRAVAEGAGAPVNWAAHKLGAPDLFNAGLTPEQIAENKAMAEANPLTEMGGHMVGEIAGLKGFGVAKAAGAASGLAKGAIARGALGAGIEGAGLGTISAMEDPDASAEHVLASGALGSLLGAGTGAVFSAAGRGLSKVFGKANAFEDTVASPEHFSRAKDIYNSAVSVASKTPKEILEEVGPFGTRRAEAEAASHGLEQTINKQALEMQPLITKVDENVDAITRRVRDSLMKKESLAEIAGKDFETPTRISAAKGLVNGAYESIAPQLREIEEFEAANPEVRIPAQTRRELNALRSELEDAVDLSQTEGTRAIDNWSLANGIKQKLDTVVKGLRTDTRRLSGSISSNQSRNMLEIAKGLQAAADNTRESLMSEQLWGKAVAGAQRDVNEIWSGGAISAMKRFGKNFMRDTGEEHYFRGGNIFENDPAQTAKALRSLGTPEGWLSETAMGDYIEHAGKLIDTIGEKYGVEGGEKALIDETKRQLTELKARFGGIKDQADLAKKYERMLGIEEKNKGIANSLPLLGGVLGGPVGAGIGVAARGLLQPGALAHGLSEMARATERVHSVTEGVKTWLSKGAGAVSATGRNRVTTSAALHVWSRKGKADRETYQERATTVANADLASIGPHIDGLPPDVQAAAGGGTARAIQYLQALLPAKAGGPTLMNPSRSIVAAVPEQQKFAKAWATVVDPTSAIRDLKRGSLSPIQVQALKTVYPRLYDDIRLNALQGIAQADASGKAIPLHTRQQLSLLLDLGGAAQPAFSDQMVDIIQQGLAAQTANKPPAKQNAPHLAQSMRSPSQQPEIKS